MTSKLAERFKLERRPIRFESHETPARRPDPPGPDQIARLKREWTVLISTLDFESDDWYERGDIETEGAWHRVGFFRVHDLLTKELGYISADEITRRMIHRDREAFRRGHKAILKPIKNRAEKRAQADVRFRAEADQQDFDLR